MHTTTGARGISIALAALIASACVPAQAQQPGGGRSWSGFYVGASVGASNASSEQRLDPTSQWGTAGSDALSVLSATGSFSTRDWTALGGGQAGYNWQFGSIVLGLEGGVEARRLSVSRDTGVLAPPPNSAQIGTYQYVASVRSDWEALLRGRAGYAFAGTLVYVTGGLALSQLKQSQRAEFISQCGGGALCTTDSSSSGLVTGWTAGVGVEYMLMRNWSIRGEYQHTDFGSFGGALPPLGISPLLSFDKQNKLSEDNLQIGLNYRF